MSPLTTSDKIYIKQSNIPNSGRGVFAKTPIKKGESIEQCPVIEIPTDDAANLTDSIMITYVYHLGKNKEHTLFPLGFGALYNHTYTPNAEYKGVLKEGLVDFIAVKDIEKDEEITVNYNTGNAKGKTPLWFE